MPHTYSVETIYHFTCVQCKNWWSYAVSSGQVPSAFHCPFCGHLDKTQSQDTGHITQPMVKLTPQRVACGD